MIPPWCKTPLYPPPSDSATAAAMEAAVYDPTDHTTNTAPAKLRTFIQFFMYIFLHPSYFNFYLHLLFLLATLCYSDTLINKGFSYHNDLKKICFSISGHSVITSAASCSCKTFLKCSHSVFFFLISFFRPTKGSEHLPKTHMDRRNCGSFGLKREKIQKYIYIFNP